jgi:hypothetical protein
MAEADDSPVMVKRNVAIWDENNGKLRDEDAREKHTVAPIRCVAGQLFEDKNNLSYVLSTNPITEGLIKQNVFVGVEDLSHLVCWNCGFSFKYTQGRAFPLPDMKLGEKKYRITNVLVHGVACGARYIKDRYNLAFSPQTAVMYDMAKTLFGIDFVTGAEIAPDLGVLQNRGGWMTPEEYITDKPSRLITEVAPFMVPHITVLQCLSTVWDDAIPEKRFVQPMETIWRPTGLKRPESAGPQPAVPLVPANPTLYDTYMASFQTINASMFSSSAAAAAAAAATSLFDARRAEDVELEEEEEEDDEDAEEEDVDGAGGGGGGGGGGGDDDF